MKGAENKPGLQRPKGRFRSVPLLFRWTRPDSGIFVGKIHRARSGTATAASLWLPTMPRKETALLHVEGMSPSDAPVKQGRNLTPMDRGGTSDPFVTVTCGNNSVQTDPHKRTLNPVWNAPFDL